MIENCEVASGGHWPGAVCLALLRLRSGAQAPAKACSEPPPVDPMRIIDTWYQSLRICITLWKRTLLK